MYLECLLDLDSSEKCEWISFARNGSWFVDPFSLFVGSVAASIAVLKRTENSSITEREWMHIEAVLSYSNGDMHKACKKWMEVLMKFAEGKYVVDASLLVLPFLSSFWFDFCLFFCRCVRSSFGVWLHITVGMVWANERCIGQFHGSCTQEHTALSLPAQPVSGLHILDYLAFVCKCVKDMKLTNSAFHYLS